MSQPAQPEFGISLAPTHDVPHVRHLTVTAERHGLDLVGVQDHPYVPQFLDTFSLIGHLLDHTERIRLFPDVANLPLRPPAMLARAAAALNVLSHGRFELGIGAGGYWDAIASMGVPRRSPAEALHALDEAITIIRDLWRPGHDVRFHGKYYDVSGVQGADAGAPPIQVWIGAQGPRSLALTGRVADGWAAPIPSYLPYERWSSSNADIDRAAEEHGRDPRSILRIAQLPGLIEPGKRAGTTQLLREGSEPLRADADGWVAELTRLGTEQPFTAYVFWPQEESADQVRRFAEDIAPRVRTNLTP
ncbi:N5,N10-methylene tetrahydromethanopterin reductase [Sphaerisporangium melleum]|uniref:N5,N10-methylene tetrahydromethanopterin reductase n=1 Tax=Sphaerisporangium melleum TaxID=321316 RepID=A0A917R5W0_9ACTN|nr:LLM class flavin-dependent oxidoreductase [Sphaerisporangium melleum]GGK91997.1 N5,N10-methylene tetrahydromethanopterin reductase [Sphaerisporangium melleum]GII72966.1 N5,N10-methylene tetrahydromethanopterin reductase [Sphaerisporangium melleum]